eukprot:TRINITY_DN4052_c0_g3_i1.p1 TRINITY_DN4052_c0_g3~~TRINITY_DN4052_c0_g3_i1.p1  ORF type:complete len:185 (+),score=45.00 TRINITY_DN4052_c0_g3_i1:413-967(+)
MQAATHPTTELIELNIANANSTVLGQFATFNQAKYSGDDIYVTAGPDFKEGLGRNLPENMLANNYDGQLYLLTDNGKNAAPLSREFDPAIGQLEVLPNGDAIVKVTEQDTIALYLYDKSKQHFSKLNTGFDVVEQFSYSTTRSPAILVSGSNASSPQQLKQLTISKTKQPHFRIHNRKNTPIPI